MTDYLEQFFVVREENEPEQNALRARADSAAEASAEEKKSNKSAENVETDGVNLVRRVQQELSLPEAEQYRFPIRRAVGEKAGEDLEHRLRRDSRRYDSGFYWY